MRVANFEFSARLLPTLVMLVLLAVLISLGIWQLGRADEKQQMLTEQVKKAQQPAYEVTPEDDNIHDIEYRKIRARGELSKEYRIYIDNKVYKGKVGYYVVEPLRLAGSDVAVLVNRGWVAATNSRAVFPEVANSDSVQLLEGIVKIDTKDVASFGAGNRAGKDWPALVRWIDINELKKSLPFKLKPYMLLQTNDSRDGLVREWTFAGSPPEKNRSYALQWFSLAVALVLIYLVVNTKKMNP